MKNAEEITIHLTSVATSILQGINYSEFRENLHPEAYVINNNVYESIFEVLGNASKKESLIEGKDLRVGFVHVRVHDDLKTAYLILESKSDKTLETHWNTIIFKISKYQKWQIISWHKS
jgi:hypothetical protein